jgi:hypothetical protein
MTTQLPALQRKWHRRPEAAEYVRQKYNQPCSPATLATWATIGGGPPFFKAGNTALYDQVDLDDWALDRMGQPRRSTSESEAAIGKARSTKTTL